MGAEVAVEDQNYCSKTPHLLRRLRYRRRPSVTFHLPISSGWYVWSRPCAWPFRTKKTGGRGMGGLWQWPPHLRIAFMLFVWWIPSRNLISAENGRTLWWWQKNQRSAQLTWSAKQCGAVGCHSTVSIPAHVLTESLCYLKNWQQKVLVIVATFFVQLPDSVLKNNLNELSDLLQTEVTLEWLMVSWHASSTVWKNWCV